MRITFDDYLVKYIGFGRGQMKQFCVLSLVEFLDGFAILILVILLSILKKEWELSDIQIMFLASISFLGTAFGLLIQGFYVHVIGRERMLQIAMFLNFLTILSQALVRNYTQTLITRFIFGVVFGLGLPISLILMAEQVPYSYRGRVVTSLKLMYLFGTFYMFFCCFIFLDNLQEGNWRAIFLFNSIPAFICFLGSCFIVKESPRFQLSEGLYSQAFQRLNELGIQNDKNYVDLSSEQKDGLVKSQLQKQSHIFKRRITDLFKHGNKYITINLWIIMFLWNIQCASIFLLIPFILQESGNGFLAMFISFFWELPATIVVISLIDSQEYGGRKKMVIFGLVTYVLAEFFMYTYKAPTVVFGMTVIRICDKIVWLSLDQMKLESYGTFYRSLGVGAVDAVGKVAAALASFVVFPLFTIDPYLPFIILGSLSLVTIILVSLHPIELTQKPLDESLQVESLISQKLQ